MTSETMLASASSGHELAVFGSFLAAGAADADDPVACGACPCRLADDAGARVAATGAAPPDDAVAVGTVAFTSLWVMTCGGFDVMMVALSTSPEWKSDSSAGLPSRMIFTPR